MKIKMKLKKALITGITGQDGSYLTEYLLSLGYEVHGIKRRSSSFNTQRIDHLYQDEHQNNSKLFLHYGDLTDSTSLIRIISLVQPDEIYNLAAMSHVHVSFDMPEYTSEVSGLGALRILEAIRLLGYSNQTKFYQASTSELYGKVLEIPQVESTPFYPRSPYAVAKLFAYWMTVNYREAYGMFACNGILFNHESPRRGETFVTRKITRGLARIMYGLDDCLYLGNLESKRDWGHARDYVKGMHLILQSEEPDDFVLSTGTTSTVREFIILCFEILKIEIVFKGVGLDEIAVVESNNSKYLINNGKTVIKIDKRYFRKTEVDHLEGDYSKARKILNWQPETTLKELAYEMLISDLKSVHDELYGKRE